MRRAGALETTHTFAGGELDRAAHVRGDDRLLRELVDPAEIESARWFTARELGESARRWDDAKALRLPPPITIAHQLALAWLAGLEEAGGSPSTRKTWNQES